MPITIKSTGMKYKNPDTGVYQGVDMLEEATIRDVIVDAYSPTLPYAVGEYCLYNGELYCCTTAIPSGGEAWNLAHWDKTNVTDELESIKGTVDSIGSDDVANESNVSGTTVSDALDTLDGVIDSLGSDDIANESNVTGTTVSDALDTLDGAITHDTMHDTHTLIETNPSSLEAIQAYDVGIYRVTVPDATIFPARFGILEILKGEQYSMARFSNVNSSAPTVWRVQWYTSSGDWYQNGVWLDEQKYVKENKISKSGDTYTGALTYHTDQYTSGTAPSATKYVPFFQLSDTANTNIVIFQGTSYVNGDEGFEIVARRSKNGSWAYNSLRLMLDSSSDPKVYVTNDGAWRKGLSLCYDANDTESSTASNPIYGVIQSSNNVVRSVFLEFTVAKSIENISTITVTALTGRIYGINGEIDNLTANADYTSGNYTATAIKLSNTRIRILIAKSSAYVNATVNTPVVYWGTVGLKFT